MSTPHDIFERNLGQLLRRAYVPARPEADFVARAEAAFLGAVPERANVARTVGSRPSLRPWLAAAATLLVVLAGWWMLGDQGARTREELLDGRHVAVRDAPSGRWQVAPRQGAMAEWVWNGAFLQAATPAGASLAVDLSDGAVLTLSPSSLARLEADEPLRARLAAGRLALSQPRAGGETPGSRWRMDTPDGALLLEHGRLEVSRSTSPHGAHDLLGDDGRTFVVLHSGAGWLLRADERLPLPVGVVLILQDGRILGSPFARGAGMPVPPTAVPEPIPDADAPDDAPDAPLAAVGPHTLVGRVVDAESGEPVTAFEITLVTEHYMSGFTEPVARAFESEAGHFLVADIPPMVYRVFVNAEGYAAWRLMNLEVTADEALEPLEVGLLPDDTSVSGVVISAVTGEPLVGALVLSETDTPSRLLPMSVAQYEGEDLGVYTDEDGAFTLTGLSAGTQALRVMAAGHGPLWSGSFPLERGEHLQGLLFELRAGATVSGRITRPGGAPWAGAMVSVSMPDDPADRPCLAVAPAFTDEEGRYVVDDLPAMRGVVLLIGDLNEMGLSAGPKLQPIVIEAGESQVVDFLSDGSGGRLRGLLYQPNGEPLVGWTVSISPVGVSAEDSQSTWTGSSTTADGAFEFINVGPGDYHVLVSRGAEVNITQVSRVTVGEGADVVHDVHLPAGGLRGRVFDAGTGEPIVGALVLLNRLGGVSTAESLVARLFTGNDGVVDVRHLSAGRYSMAVFAEDGRYGQEFVREIVVAGHAAVEGIEIGLEPGGSVRVLVRRPDGTPLPDVPLRFVDQDGLGYKFSMHQATDATGRHLAPGIATGTWRVSAALPGFAADERLVEVEAGRTTEVELVLRPSP